MTDQECAQDSHRETDGRADQALQAGFLEAHLHNDENYPCERSYHYRI
jgi:hypothetical protein